MAPHAHLQLISNIIKALFITTLYQACLQNPSKTNATFISTQTTTPRKMKTTPLHIFGDLFKEAFSNDPNLSKNDRVTGQLDDATSLPLDAFSPSQSEQPKTEVQKRWLESQGMMTTNKQQMTTAATTATVSSSNNNRFGAPILPEVLIGTRWNLSLYLTGIPARDPSSDLYGEKTNISTRQKRRLTVGGDSSSSSNVVSLPSNVPDEPTLTDLMIKFQPNGEITTSRTPFTAGTTNGKWILSQDGRRIRFSMDCLGYKRTIRTKGTLTKVFWSDGEGVTSDTSSEYTIPTGWVYGEVDVGYGSRPGSLVMGDVRKVVEDEEVRDGVLMIEKTMGLLGAASKMIPCGIFTGIMVDKQE